MVVGLQRSGNSLLGSWLGQLPSSCYKATLTQGHSDALTVFNTDAFEAVFTSEEQCVVLV